VSDQGGAGGHVGQLTYISFFQVIFRNTVIESTNCPVCLVLRFLLLRRILRFLLHIDKDGTDQDNDCGGDTEDKAVAHRGSTRIDLVYDSGVRFHRIVILTTRHFKFFLKSSQTN